MIKLSVYKTNKIALLARALAFILWVLMQIFDFAPEKLPRLSRNRP